MTTEVAVAKHGVSNLGHKIAVPDALHHLLPSPQLLQVPEQLPGLQERHNVVVQHLAEVEGDRNKVQQIVFIKDLLDFLDSLRQLLTIQRFQQRKKLLVLGAQTGLPQRPSHVVHVLDKYLCIDFCLLLTYAHVKLPPVPL